MSTERTLLILGMHRSGTSACTRLLNLCGAHLAGDLLPANAANVTGYWEPSAIVALHDALLAEAGSAWDDPTEFPAAWMASREGQGYVDRLVELLRREEGGATLTVVKDPRACRLVPLWRQALASVHREPAMLLVVRHPLEVAASLERRDAMPASQALLLWLEHVLAAEESTRGDRRLIVTYDQILTDWQAVVARVEDALAIALPNRGPGVDAEIAAFLDPALRHESATSASLDERPDVSEWVRRVYRWHERASRDPESVSVAELDAVRRELRHAAVTYAPLVRWYRHERAQQAAARAAAQQQLDLREAHEAAWQEQLGAWRIRERQLTDDLKAMTDSRDEQQHAAAALQEQVDTMEASAFWKLRNLISRK
ncbi:MAG: hypothetical protein ABI634_04750 [Acidobacteriota bacterium]